KRAEDELKALQEQPKASGMGITGRLSPPDPAQITAAQKRLDDARIALGQARDRFKRGAYDDPYTMAPVTVTDTKTGGGGGGGVDRFAQTLQGLKDQADAVRSGIQELSQSTGLATKEAERLSKLTIDIGRDTAAAVRHAGATTPEQKAQIA